MAWFNSYTKRSRGFFFDNVFKSFQLGGTTVASESTNDDDTTEVLTTNNLHESVMANITSVGTLGNVTVTNTMQGGNIRISGNDLRNYVPGQNLVISAPGAGIVNINDSLTVTNDATITGNLTVNGTTTTVNSTNTTIADPLYILNNGQTGTPTKDSGFVIERGSSNNVAWIWDESADKFVAVTTSEDGTTAGDIGIIGYADMQAKDITANAFSGDGSALTGIAEAQVTQHQSALSITESQISDLNSYITASSTDTLTNKSGAISQWTNDTGYITGYTVTEGDVTGHQAALTITESQISDLTHTSSLPFSSITSTPTTLSGYGITDGYTDSDVDTHLNQSNPTAGYVLSWNGSDYAWVDNAGYHDSNVATYLTTATGDVQTGNLTVSASSTVEFNENILGNIGTPVASTDAASKAYVDGQLSSFNGDSFSSIVVSGQSTISASGSTALTFAAGSGTAITTDAGTDTITIQVETSIFGGVNDEDLGSTADSVTQSEDLGDLTTATNSENLGSVVALEGVAAPTQLILPEYETGSEPSANPEGQLIYQSGAIKLSNGNTWQSISVNTSLLVEQTSTTGSAYLPRGTTAQRDGSPSAGYMRFNSEEGSFEGYNGSEWGSIGGGASAKGVIYENTTTISENYTLTSGTNGMSVGPITLDAGVSVTVPPGQRWVIL